MQLNKTKEELISLLESIKEETGMTQGQISEAAGYDANYISVVLSRNQISKKMLNNIKQLRNKKSVQIEDAMSASVDLQLETLAACRVMLSVLSELQAPGLKRLPAELSGIYLKMVADQKELIARRLSQKE